MKGPPCQLSAVLFAGGYLLALGGCGKTAGPDTTREQDGPEVAYFSPHPGETWKYKVQKEIPIELRLSEADAALRPQPTDTAHLITFEQIRTCTGEREIEALGKTLTTIAISENGKVMGEELYQLGPEGILSWGWIPANVKNGEAHLLEEGVAIATPDMQPGQTWEWLGRDSGNPFLFRVIERGMVTVPAGTFQATRIQITSEKISPHPVTGDDHVTYLKRSLWFAKDVGVIKEDIVYYGEQHVRVRQRSELVHWVVPSGGPPPKKVMVNTDGTAPGAPEAEEPFTP